MKMAATAIKHDQPARRRLGGALALVALLAMVAALSPVARRVSAAVPASRVAAGSAWTVSGGPPGPVYALLALPAGGGLPAELLAGGTSRVAMSTDGGSSWHSSYDALTLSGQITTLLAVGSGPTPPILAATTAGLFRSTDRGVHWTHVAGGLPAGHGVIALTQSGKTLFAGTGDQDSTGALGGSGLYASQDGGVKWTATALPKGAGTFVSTVAMLGSTLYVGTESGTVYTTTGHLYVRPAGKSFSRADSGLPGNYGVNTLFAGAGFFIAGTASGFYQSRNGATWTRASQGTTKPDVFTVVRDPHNATVLYGGSLGSGRDTPGAGVWKSVDNGHTWRPANAGLLNYMDVHAILIQGAATGGETFYVASDGVWRSTNGQTWTPASSGLNLGQVQVLAVDPLHPKTLVAGVSYSGFYRSTDGGHTWQVSNRGLVNNNPQVLAFGGSDTLYAATESQIVRWDSKASAWVALDSKLATPRELSAFAVGPVSGGTDVMYVAGIFGATATSFEVLRSTDLGRTWKNVTPPVNATGTAGAIRILAAASTDPNIVYAATTTSLYVSSNGGSTWTTTGPTSKNPTAITALAVDPASAQTAYIGLVNVNANATSTAAALTAAILYSTSDGGAHWSSVRTYGAGTLIVHVHPGQNLVVLGAHITGAQVGAVVEQRNGRTWSTLAAGLPVDGYGNAAATDGDDTLRGHQSLRRVGASAAWWIERYGFRHQGSRPHANVGYSLTNHDELRQAEESP